MWLARKYSLQLTHNQAAETESPTYDMRLAYRMAICIQNKTGTEEAWTKTLPPFQCYTLRDISYSLAWWNVNASRDALAITKKKNVTTPFSAKHQHA